MLAPWKESYNKPRQLLKSTDITLLTNICWGSLEFPQFCLATAKIWSDERTSVIAQFCWQAKENISLRHEGKPTQETQRKEEPSLNFGFSFYVFFLLSLSLPYINWAFQEGCLFYLRSSLQSSDLLLFYSCGLFSSLCFSHHHSGLLFPILTT